MLAHAIVNVDALKRGETIKSATQIVPDPRNGPIAVKEIVDKYRGTGQSLAQCERGDVFELTTSKDRTLWGIVDGAGKFIVLPNYKAAVAEVLVS